MLTMYLGEDIEFRISDVELGGLVYGREVEKAKKR